MIGDDVQPEYPGRSLRQTLPVNSESSEVQFERGRVVVVETVSSGPRGRAYRAGGTSTVLALSVTVTVAQALKLSNPACQWGPPASLPGWPGDRARQSMSHSGPATVTCATHRRRAAAVAAAVTVPPPVSAALQGECQWPAGGSAGSAHGPGKT